ncbi:molybdenum cofactor biosynthesis protein A [Raoultella planticola]|nr:molybdenum cofactor biosynthesis protein A [Raoultella planticola]
METGEGSDPFRRHHISGMVLRDELLRRGWIHQIKRARPGPGLCHPDYAGEIGLIMPYEKDFCASCNRLRVSSVGKLHLCLFGDGGVDLRDLLVEDQQQAALEARISEALTHKTNPFPASGQHRYYAKPVVYWRIIDSKGANR